MKDIIFSIFNVNGGVSHEKILKLRGLAGWTLDTFRFTFLVLWWINDKINIFGRNHRSF